MQTETNKNQEQKQTAQISVLVLDIFRCGEGNYNAVASKELQPWELGGTSCLGSILMILSEEE